MALRHALSHSLWVLSLLVFPHKQRLLVMVSVSELGLLCLPPGSQCIKIPDNMMM